jgi:hypothetical protein
LVYPAREGGRERQRGGGGEGREGGRERKGPAQRRKNQSRLCHKEVELEVEKMSKVVKEAATDDWKMV